MLIDKLRFFNNFFGLFSEKNKFFFHFKKYFNKFFLLFLLNNINNFLNNFFIFYNGLNYYKLF